MGLLSYQQADKKETLAGCPKARAQRAVRPVKKHSGLKEKWFLLRGQRKKVLRLPLRRPYAGWKSVPEYSPLGPILGSRSKGLPARRDALASLMKATIS